MNRYNTYKFLSDCMSMDFRNESFRDIILMIQSGDLDWNKFFQIGSNHLVLQNLYRCFSTQQVLEYLPESVSNELHNIYTLNKERNNKILSAALEINHLLRSNHITPVFLKGVSHLMNQLYHEPGERIMADIDFMVSRDQILPAVEILTGHGYIAPIKLSPDLNHIYKKHYPRLHKPGMPAYVEIHWEAAKPKYAKNFKYAELFERKIPSRLYPDCYTLTMEDSVVHNFIHSQLENGGHIYARIFLRNMYDLLLLSRSVDLQEAFSKYGLHSKKSASYIHLTEKVFGVPLASSDNRAKSNKLFLYRHKLNVSHITLSFLFQVFSHFYISYIKKVYLAITDRRVRALSMQNLSKREWYKQHFKSYKNIFSKK